MDTNERPKMLLKEEVYNIVGAGMEVLNELGHGFNEKPYENALVVEFQLRNIPYLQQPNYKMTYKGHPVGLFISDLIAFNPVVVDTKVVDRITDVERGQIINYLFEDYKVASRSHSEFQTSKTRMGKNSALIRVHSWF